MTVRLRDLLLGLRDLGLAHAPVIVHSSLKSFGPLEGGPGMVVNALVSVFNAVLVPTFTYKTMVTPLVGPENNAITYGSQPDLNHMAEFFTARLPADPLMGIIADTLRRHPRALRSTHPIQSFAGVNTAPLINAQTMTDHLSPIGLLERADGWVILMGVDHTVNTSIHYAEKLAGRRGFVRWALTPKGVVECPGFPGCSAGFQAVAPDIDKFTRRVQVGECLIQAVPLKMLFRVVKTLIKQDPQALLCHQTDCERCNAIRAMA